MLPNFPAPPLSGPGRPGLAAPADARGHLRRGGACARLPRELGAIDNAAYRSINHTDTLNASVHLRRLRDLELLAMKGSGSRTYYVPGALFAIRAGARRG